ncbi:MAG TPA: hypothetical protein VKU80_13320 [Planctomycetota bacterium]|nr:hypothetical protein [Planctomycetota bacterium]
MSDREALLQARSLWGKDGAIRKSSCALIDATLRFGRKTKIRRQCTYYLNFGHDLSCPGKKFVYEVGRMTTFAGFREFECLGAGNSWGAAFGNVGASSSN